MDSLPVSIWQVAFEKIGDRTLRMTDHQKRQHFQWRFIEALRKITYFRVIVDRDLRPLWRELSANDQALHWIEDLPAESNYVKEVARLVGARMRCTSEGKPAAWVMQGIHTRVLKLSQTTTQIPEPIAYARRDLSVGVNHIGMAEIQQLQNRPGGRVQVDEVQVIDQPYAAFDNWDELRRVAHAQLDDLIDALQQQYLEATADYKPVRPGTLKHLTEENMRQLIGWLWPEAKLQHNLKRDTRRRLVRDLGLD